MHTLTASGKYIHLQRQESIYTYSDRKVYTLTETGKYIHLQRPESTYTHSDRKVHTITETGKYIHSQRPSESTYTYRDRKVHTLSATGKYTHTHTHVWRKMEAENLWLRGAHGARTNCRMSVNALWTNTHTRTHTTPSAEGRNAPSV